MFGPSVIDIHAIIAHATKIEGFAQNEKQNFLQSHSKNFQISVLDFAYFIDKGKSQNSLFLDIAPAIDRLLPILIGRIEEGFGESPLIKLIQPDGYLILNPENDVSFRGTPEARRASFKLIPEQS